MKWLLLLLLPCAGHSAETLKVRVFYDAEGKFLAKFIKAGRAAPSVTPPWAVGACDIPGRSFRKADAAGPRARVRPENCSFYQADMTPDEAREQAESERLAALERKLKNSSATQAETQEALAILIKRALRRPGAP